MASLWTEVRDAVRGTGADYTKIPLRRAVFTSVGLFTLWLFSRGRWKTANV